jgi:hypothetical protein
VCDGSRRIAELAWLEPTDPARGIINTEKSNLIARAWPALLESECDVDNLTRISRDGKEHCC